MLKLSPGDNGRTGITAKTLNCKRKTTLFMEKAKKAKKEGDKTEVKQ